MHEQTGDPAELSEIARLALASAQARDRELWWSFFALDARLAKIVGSAREPVLAQMRFAWWREQFATPRATRPMGDAVLDAAGRRWQGEEQGLSALVDGWENLLGETPFSLEAMVGFATGRGKACETIARMLQVSTAATKAAKVGECWSFAELAARRSEASERAQALELATALLPPVAAMPRALRPLAVIGGLARRSLARGGAAMVGDRMSPLVALRLGIIGR